MHTTGSQPQTEPLPSPLDGHRGGGDTDWPLVETLQSTLLGVAMAILGIAPRSGAFVLGALALATSIEAIRARRTARPSLPSLAGIAVSPAIALAALLAWAALSSAWASDPSLAARSVAQVAVIALAAAAIAYLLPAQLAALPPQRRWRFLRAVPAGFLVGLAFVAVEFVSHNAISHAMIARFPRLMGDNAKDFVRDGDKLLGFLPFYLDRNVAALSLALPAVALALRRGLPSRSGAWAALLVMAAAAIVIAVSWSGAAKLAALSGLVIAAFWSWRPVAVSIALQVLLATGIVLAIPIAGFPARIGLDQAAALPPSARERIEIWGRTAVAVGTAPVRGIGAQSTRFVAGQERMRVDGIAGDRRALGWHSHNVVLQTWLELGAVGAALLLWTMIALVRAIGRLEQVAQPAAAALLVMVTALAVTGWGMWQPWLAAAVGIALAGLVSLPQGGGNAIHQVTDKAPGRDR